MSLQLTSPSPWMTADEAAQYLRAKRRSILRWVREGKLKAQALSGSKRHVWRFRREDLDEALLSRPVLDSSRQLCSQPKGGNEA